MRSLATGERALLGGTPLSVKGKVEVMDSDGTWRDVSSLGGLDFFLEADWSANPDDPVQSATIVLARQAGTSNIAPLMGSSLINRNAASAYVPFLKENSRLRLWTAEGLPGFTVGSNANNSWHLVFEGKIDDVIVTRTRVTLNCRDIGAFLQQASVETETAYGTDPAPGTLIETIMQQIITAWVPNPPTMVVPVPSGAYRTATLADGTKFTVKPGNVMEILQNFAAEIGWVCRYEWGSGNTYELRFYRPGTKVSDDTTFDNTEYISLNELKTSDSDIRNVVKSTWKGLNVAEISATATDSASIGAPGNYGRRFMLLAMDQRSGVDTVPELQALSDAAVADLSTPYASHRIETFYFWPVERGDRHGYLSNNWAYDSTQTFYVVDFTHHIGRGLGRTTINARGKPISRYRTWWEIFGVDRLPDNSLLDIVATEFATTYSIAWSGTGVISLSIDGGAWITAPTSPLNTSPIVVTRNIENGATKIYRFRTVLGDDITYETIYVLPIGAVAPPPDLSVTPSVPATLSQAYTVTCTNPRAGGAAPTVTVFSVGAGGTVALFGGGSATVVDGASPITIPSGSVVTMTRPLFGAPAGSVIFRGIIAGGGLAEIQRTVTPRQSIGPNLTVTPTPFVSTYSIAWSGDGVTLSIDGGAFAAPPASPIIVNRPAIGSADKVYTFKGTLDGQTITNTITIPAVGSPETPNLTVTTTTSSDTQMVYTVTATSPTSGVTPTILGFLKDATFADGHTDGGSITSGTTVTINRPAFGNKRDGIFRVKASIGTSYEEIVNNVPPRVQLSFGPTLVVTPIPFATSYSLYWSGDSVSLSIDNGAWISAPTSPLNASPVVVTRNLPGGADKLYSFRAAKDGQEVTNSITVPAQGAQESPNLNVTPSTPTSTQQSFTVTFASATGTPTCNVYLTGCTSSTHSDGASVTSGATVTINKPAFGSQAGSVRFRATLGSEYEEVTRTIVTQIKTSFGPTLDVGVVTGATSYSINYNGGSATVTYYEDTGGPYSIASSGTLVIARNLPRGQAKHINLRADLDGQLISNDVVVPPQDPKEIQAWITYISALIATTPVSQDITVAWDFNASINDTDHRIMLAMGDDQKVGFLPSSGSSGVQTYQPTNGAGQAGNWHLTVTVYRPADGKAVITLVLPLTLTLVNAY